MDYSNNNQGQRATITIKIEIDNVFGLVDFSDDVSQRIKSHLSHKDIPTVFAGLGCIVKSLNIERVEVNA